MAKNRYVKQNVVPFEQKAVLFHRKGTRHLQQHNLMEALHFYRKAAEKDPENLEYLLDLAQVYSEMGYFQQSNDILFDLIQRKKGVTSECYYGLGCNFIGMEDYPRAQESFEKYLEMDEDGEYALEVEDFLELLYSKNLYVDSDGMPVDGRTGRLYRMAGRAKALLDQGEFKKAVRLFKVILEQDDSMVFVHNNLSLAYHCLGRKEKAFEEVYKALRLDPKNVHALCNLALYQHKTGKPEARDKALEYLMELIRDGDEGLYKAAVTLCEMELHELARPVLIRLVQQMPYDKRVLHYMAACYFHLGEYDKALHYWQRVERLDPHNTVASYYMEIVRAVIHGELDPAKTEVSYYFQVPYVEIIRRIHHLNQYVKEGRERLAERWQDPAFRALLWWGLDINDDAIKKAVLLLIAEIGDGEAQRMLRSFILRKDENDEVKWEVFALLKMTGAPEPYITYVDGNIMEVQVSVVEGDDDKKAGEFDDEVLKLTLARMKDRYAEGYAEKVEDLWQRYLGQAGRDFSQLARLEGWAASLEYCYCRQADMIITKRTLAAIYDTTAPTIDLYVAKMLNVLEGGRHAGNRL
jgi:tetratricopeptide (TPR) repeat protein